jgi:hypothetical protein
MEDEQSAADLCHGCGSPDVKHRSHLLRQDEQSEKLVLLCDNCHRELLEPAAPDPVATDPAEVPLRVVKPE